MIDWNAPLEHIDGTPVRRRYPELEVTDIVTLIREDGKPFTPEQYGGHGPYGVIYVNINGSYGSEVGTAIIRNRLPANWAIEQAIELLEYRHITIAEVKRYNKSWSDVINVAKYIEKHSEAPLDPVMVAAREYYISLHENDDSNIRDSVEKGFFDGHSTMDHFIAGANWAMNKDKA